MSAFLEGFLKKAAAKQPPVEPGPSVEAPLPPGAAAPEMTPMEAERPEMLLKWNALGGVDPRSPEAMQTAEAADLLTLPEEVEGANCGNCQFGRMLDPATGHIFCTNPQVQQDVTPRMVCANWDHPGAHRAAEAVDQATMIPDAGMLQEADAMANGEMPMDGGAVDPATGEPMAPEGGPEAPAPAGEMEGTEDGSEQPENTSPEDKAPAKKKPSPSKKKESGSGANSITINVGHGGAEKKAGLPGLPKNDVTKVVMERFRQRAGRMLRGARKPSA